MIMIIAALVAVVGGALLWFDIQARSYSPAQPVLTSEAKSYVKNLDLMDVQMQAAESYFKQAVIEIEGKIANNGDRQLSAILISCVFYDVYGQVVLRERVPIVRSKNGGLGPGERRDFRLAFDSLPQSWNQQMPQLVIAQIDFGT